MKRKAEKSARQELQKERDELVEEDSTDEDVNPFDAIHVLSTVSLQAIFNTKTFKAESLAHFAQISFQRPIFQCWAVSKASKS